MYAPGAATRDLAGSPIPLVPKAGGLLASQYGPAWSVPAGVTNGTLATATVPPGARAQALTLFWLGRIEAVPSNDYALTGILINGSPYWRAVIYLEAGPGMVNTAESYNGSFTGHTSGISISSIVGRWVLIAATYTSGTVQIFVDGVLAYSASSGTGTLPYSSSDTFVGFDDRTSPGLTLGAMGIFNRVLRADEIALFSRDPFGMFRPSMVDPWRGISPFRLSGATLLRQPLLTVVL